MTPRFYDDDGQLVPSVDFSFPEDHDPERLLAAIAATRSIVAALMSHVAVSRRPQTAGRRVLAMAWVLGAMPDVRTQKQLASLLGVSPARVSKLTAEAKSFLSKQRRAA